MNNNYGREYSRTSNNNPCPICNDTKGKCQIHRDENFVMCMDSHYEVSGWNFIGVDKSGTWGMHTLTSVVLSEQEKLERKEAKERADLESKEAHRKEALPVNDRDKAIKAIHKHLGLSSTDKARLIGRGLIQSQIEQGLFFSVHGSTTIPNNIPNNLPGVTIDKISGNKKLYAEDAFACPAFNYEGKPIGWQYRNNQESNSYTFADLNLNAKKSTGKYTWPKGIKSSHLPNGELPITFISADKFSNKEKTAEMITQQWLEGGTPPTNIINQIDRGVTGLNEYIASDSDDLEKTLKLKVIFATEGLLKPYIASCRHGVDTMGAAGFNFSTSHEQVTEIIVNGNYNYVVFPLDGGAIANSGIMNQLAKNVALVESLGCQVAIGWWDQNKKSDKDFDEIKSLDQVRLMDYEDFKIISEKAIYKKNITKKLKELTKFTADKVIDRSRFYLEGETSNDEIDFILDSNQVIMVRGSKASGKSYVIKHHIKKWLKSGGKVINIGCRRVLCESQSLEWNITYIGDAETESFSLSTIFERDSGLSVVVDSLLKLKHIDWSNTLIIVDECEQFVSHLLTSNTAVKDQRGYILQMIEDVFRFSLSTGGKIIALDADCSDLTSDWLESTTKVKPFKIENIYKQKDRNCYIYSGDKATYENIFIQNIFNDLALRKKIMIVSDSRKDLDALFIEIRKLFPDLVCEIITSETVADKSVRAFIKLPDETIKNTQVVMLGASPVMQSGVSINIKNCFDKVYGICTGIIEPSIMRQLLGRVRDNCDRHLWISDRARGNYSTDYDWQKILHDADSEYAHDLIEYHKSLDKHMSNRDIHLKIASLFDENDLSTDINSITKAKLTARRNLALSDYRAVLIDELENEGYQVTNYLPSDSESIKFECDIFGTKKLIDKNDAIDINFAEDINKNEAERLQKKSYATKKEQHQISKFIIKENFPLVVLSAEFILSYILKGRWKALNAVKRFWFTQNKEKAKHLDTKALHYQNKVALTGGKLWLGDLNPHTPYISLFERLGLSKLINDNLPIDKDSEQLIEFVEHCKDYQKIDGISNRELLRRCGIKFNNSQSPIQLLSRVLELFGHKTQCINQVRKKDGRIRNYKIVKLVDSELWTELIAGFDLKYNNIEPIKYDFELEINDNFMSDFSFTNGFKEKIAITDTEQCLEGGTPPTNIINQIDRGVTGLNEYIATDLDDFEKTDQSETKLSLNNQNKIGKKCNFWNNKNQESTGIIEDDLGFGLKIKDSKTSEISYCAINQIELIDDDNIIGKKCNFWDNQNQWSTGFIEEILSFGLKVKDYLTSKISYCAINQIELIDFGVG